VALAVLAAIVTLVVVFFLNADWQREALTGLLEEDRERRWQFGTVEIEPQRLELTDLFILQGVAGAEVGRLELEGPFWQVPFSNVLRVERGSLEDVLLDLSSLPVGDPRGADWQDLVRRLPHDADLWEEQVSLLLRKLAASGWQIDFKDTEVSGQILLPGGALIPLQWTLLKAQTGEPPEVEMVPRLADGGLL
jgi:hypothetical protein